MDIMTMEIEMSQLRQDNLRLRQENEYLKRQLKLRVGTINNPINAEYRANSK